MVILYNKLLELFKVGMQMNDKIKENLLDQSCAPTDNLQSNWDRIDWTKAEQAVKKLQARIVKAQKEGRHNKVKALQWTLTHSFYANDKAKKELKQQEQMMQLVSTGHIWIKEEVEGTTNLQKEFNNYLDRFNSTSSNIPSMLIHALQ